MTGRAWLKRLRPARDHSCGAGEVAYILDIALDPKHLFFKRRGIVQPGPTVIALRLHLRPRQPNLPPSNGSAKNFSTYTDAAAMWKYFSAA